MSIEGQGHFFTICFPCFVCVVLYFAKILGKRLQDHLWFGFTGYNMPMIKASKIWNKLSLSPSVILVKRPVCLCLNPPSITCMHIHVDKYILNVNKVVNS